MDKRQQTNTNKKLMTACSLDLTANKLPLPLDGYINVLVKIANKDKPG